MGHKTALFAAITVTTDTHNIFHQNIIKTGTPCWKNPAEKPTIPGNN
jgi:hypothetical protein